MKTFLARLVREEAGQDLIEYALLAAFIALGAIVALQALGPAISGVFNNISGQVGTIPGGGS
jgi:pilus assembly protein Flp/PilA